MMITPRGEIVHRDDEEYTYRCSGCGVEEATTGDLPPGWEMVRTGPDGDEWTINCHAWVL